MSMWTSVVDYSIHIYLFQARKSQLKRKQTGINQARKSQARINQAEDQADETEAEAGGEISNEQLACTKFNVYYAESVI